MSVAVNTPTQAKHRVLVVDDEPDFVANLVDILEDAGFDIDSTTKPREAVELASEHRYDAAILDWRMPGLDGVRLHGLLRERQQDLATILLTAYADAETHREAEEAGFWSILEKPCDVPRIRSLLTGMTQRPRLLVVDDEKDFCQGLVEVLHQHQVRAGFCTSIAEGIGKLETSDWDIVLLDLKLPSESPRDLVQYVADSGASTDVYTVTGQPIGELGAEWADLRRLGVKALWQKPLNIPGLLAKVVPAETHDADSHEPG
ncbi:MAG: response regulator [Pirellulaceae bacterium]